MKHANTTLSCLVVMIGGTVLALSNIAEAKGYSPAMEVSATERQDIERRLTQVEERQQQMEQALQAELKRLQAELKAAKVEQLAKSGASTDE
jgi:acetolactate synthase small subunit